MSKLGKRPCDLHVERLRKIIPKSGAKGRVDSGRLLHISALSPLRLPIGRVRRTPMPQHSESRQEYGDWQTPDELARAALVRVAQLVQSPATVLEPTCGEGSFLVAASRQFKEAALVGYELNQRYVDVARSRMPPNRSAIHASDFFDVAWERVIRTLREPILVTGNPPWVTNAALGSLGSGNLPSKQNFKGLSGLDAMTGKSNFDVSEWMILRLLAALQERRATLAVLCKTAVARKVIEFSAANRWDVQPGGLWRIDAAQHFGAAVDAAFFVCMTGDTARLPQARWPVHASLDVTKASSTMAVINGSLVPRGACTPARPGRRHVDAQAACPEGVGLSVVASRASRRPEKLHLSRTARLRSLRRRPLFVRPVEGCDLGTLQADRVCVAGAVRRASSHAG